MDRKKRIFAGEIVWPVFAVIGFVAKGISRVFLDWWLPPLLQKKDNAALQADLQTNLAFLGSRGRFVREIRPKALPFDYAEVSVVAGNMQFCFTRGRGELNVSLSPNYSGSERYELGLVMAALDSKEITTIAIPTELVDLDNLFRDRFNDLNEAFSEPRYPEFAKKLLDTKQNLRLLTRQAEWELNQKLHPLRTR